MLTRSRGQGFTLIEVMIVVAVVVILMFLTLSLGSSFYASAQVRGATDEMKAALSIARAEAVKRNTTVSFSSLGTGGWSVKVAATNSVIESRADLSGDAIQVQGATTISFDGTGRPFPYGSSATFQLVPARLACGDVTCLNITVSSGGMVRVCNPAQVGGDTGC